MEMVIAVVVFVIGFAFAMTWIDYGKELDKSNNKDDSS